MTRRRVEVILAALGLRWIDFCRVVNARFGTNYTTQETRKWGKGRGVPLPVIIYLRMAVEVAQARRGKAAERSAKG